GPQHARGAAADRKECGDASEGRFAMKKLALSTKMALGSLAVGVVIVGLAIYSYLSMTSINNGVNDLYANRLRPLHMLGDIDTMVHQLENLELSYLILPDERAALRQEFEAKQAILEQTV
ncbi:MAG: MCP four helix bundle domain-containing protein, partial [Caldilinea sp.]|nr:MCP four helix bundle domain-containing protein [Caldilinea sp.]